MVGTITQHGKDSLQYRVYSNFIKIIDHFEKYPLITQKHADFELFKMAIKLINPGGNITGS